MLDPVHPVRLAAAADRSEQRPERAMELPACTPLPAAVERQIGACRRYRSSLAVLTFRVENLAAIEQRCGEFVEQQLLNLVWARLWTSVREQDIALHTGRGEFAVLIRDALTPIAVLVATRVTQLLGEPFRVNDLIVHLKVSSGHAVRMPDEDIDGASLAAAATHAPALPTARRPT